MLDQTVASLSGGQKNLLKIAQVWIQNPDLLILDEPGNHLDFKGLAWLEDFISNCGKSVLIVSHDRYLLDRVVTRTVEIDKKKATSYPGNYSFYKMERTKSMLAQQAAFGAQQKELARLDKMVKQFEAWASRSSNSRHAKQARSKQKMMDNIERVDSVQTQRRIKPTFTADDRAGQVVIEAKGFSKAFGEKVLFDNAKFVVYWGDNIGLLGDNGSGKTTLFKEILAETEKNNRENGLKIAMSAKPGYYSQEHETLDFEKTIREELSQSLNISEESAFHLSLKFLFTWDDMVKKVKFLSGGEKSRMQLAKLTYLGCNLLIMDEPTNHLDIESREELEESLLEFDGTLVVISHDRYFLDKVTTKLMTIENFGVTTFEGGFTDYWIKVGQKKLFAQKASATSVNEDAKSNRKKSGEFQDMSDSELELRINDLEGRKQDLERQMESALKKNDMKKTSVITKELRIITERIENAYSKLAGR
jgi:ATPase subunit of ABC transporter with duplicated ATPase domains